MENPPTIKFLGLASPNRWRGGALVFILGLLSGLALPPVGAWWILGLTFPLCFALIQRQNPTSLRAMFWLGWLFGFGYFIIALHWIGFAFLVDAKAYLWIMPFAVGGLAAGMALFWAAAVATSLYLAKRGLPLFLIVPFCFAGFEWLRGHILTGFPWAVPGLAADGMGGTVQLASLIGMNGLTLLIVLWAMVPLGWARGDRLSRGFAVLIALALPASWIWGEMRIAQHPTQYIDGEIVRMVQPNISQSDKWRDDNARAIFDQLLELSVRPAKAPVTVIVWPESAVPFLIDESAEGQRELQGVLAGGKILLTGAVRRSSPETSGAKPPDYFTSILAFDGEAKLIAHYDKKHLVPGGEYLPLAWLIEPLGFRKVVNLPESFSSGIGPSVVAIKGLGSVAMQVCYEAIFPEALMTAERPDWILNVTNDGWFGNSAGPYQHLAQLRLRAIEQGVGIVRVANTGVSAIINATGGYEIRSELGAVAVIDSQIPHSVEVTVYGQFGDFTLFGLMGVIFLFSVVLRRVDRV